MRRAWEKRWLRAGKGTARNLRVMEEETRQIELRLSLSEGARLQRSALRDRREKNNVRCLQSQGLMLHKFSLRGLCGPEVPL